MEQANSERQVLLPQIAGGAGKARLMSAGLRSAGVKMTPLGSKEVPPPWPETGVDKPMCQSSVQSDSALAMPLSYLSAGKWVFHPTYSSSLLSPQTLIITDTLL